MLTSESNENKLESHLYHLYNTILGSKEIFITHISYTSHRANSFKMDFVDVCYHCREVMFHTRWSDDDDDGDNVTECVCCEHQFCEECTNTLLYSFHREGCQTTNKAISNRCVEGIPTERFEPYFLKEQQQQQQQLGGSTCTCHPFVKATYGTDEEENEILYICNKCLIMEDPFHVSDAEFIHELVTRFTTFASVAEAYDFIRNRKIRQETTLTKGKDS